MATKKVHQKHSKTVTASAPGKLLLFGEHAVVHGYPAIVTAVDQRLFVTITAQTSDELVHITASQLLKQTVTFHPTDQVPNGALPKEVRFIGDIVQRFFHTQGVQQPLDITTRSEFPNTFGFGSSSAVTVATAFALDAFFQTNLTKKQLFDLCYATVLDVQGVGSGFDLAAGIWGGTLLYKRAGELIEPVALQHLPLQVVYTGIKVGTVQLIQAVEELQKREPDKVQLLFELIATIVLEGKEALEKNDKKKLGQLMNLNHGILAALGVSSKVIEQQRFNLLESGVAGAKLSGAGGGDCVIAYGRPQDAAYLEQLVQKDGGQVLDVAVNAPGVRVEEEK